MKKTKIANYLKIGILLVSVSLLLWNCEKEEINIPNEKTPNEIIVKNITLNQLERIPEFDEELSNLTRKFDVNLKELKSKKV